MKAAWVEGTVGEHGEVFLKGVALQPGQSVEMMLIVETPSTCASRKSLCHSVLEYREPFEPVAADDWEALR
jgi:hypothetical protein